MLSSSGRRALRTLALAKRSQSLTLAMSQAQQLQNNQLQALGNQLLTHYNVQAAGQWFTRPATAFSSGADNEGSRKSKKWVPDWLKNRLPEALRPADEVSPKDMTIDKYAKWLAAAQKIEKVAAYLPGSKTAAAKQDLAHEDSPNMTVFEDITRAMTDRDKSNLADFGLERRKAVAQEVGCGVSKVEECVGKYLWVREMLSQVGAAKEAGRPLPKDIDDCHRAVGCSWQDFSNAVSSGTLVRGEGNNYHLASNHSRTSYQPPSTHQLSPNHQPPPSATSVEVPKDAVAKSGEACPLAGQLIGRRITCPLTKRKYKACCGKSAMSGVTLKR